MNLNQPALNPDLKGFDEFMNVVLDSAAEIYVKDAKPRREIGQIPLCCPADQNLRSSSV